MLFLLNAYEYSTKCRLPIFVDEFKRLVANALRVWIKIVTNYKLCINCYPRR
jgi:hypothetical protein